MYNIGDDNELDRLSREASGRYPSPGNPDWDSLSAELDKVLPVDEKKKRRVIFFWWLLPVLLIGGGAAYWLMPKVDSSLQNHGITTVKQLTPSDQNPGALLTKSNVANKELKNNAAKENNSIATGKEESASQKPVANKEAEKIPVTATRKEKDLPATSLITLNGVKKSNTGLLIDEPKIDAVISTKAGQPSAEKSADPISLHPIIDNKDEVKETTPVNNAASPAQEHTEPAKEAKQAEPVPVKDNATETITTQPSKNKPNTKRGSGWSYGFLAGVDMSTVKFKYQDNAGYNFGVMAGYHFNDRISLHTGAIFTQKNYKVAGVDFTAPKGSWASYYKIDNVDGFCRMWEVPLLLRYTIGKPSNKQFFISTGLSSYFMTKENYDYYYYNNAGLLTTRHYEYDSRDTHVMSIAHLSAGFEKSISKHWSMIIEPYAKVPLAGVGLGSIHLSSFGLNLSVQHRQPSKK